MMRLKCLKTRQPCMVFKIMASLALLRRSSGREIPARMVNWPCAKPMFLPDWDEHANSLLEDSTLYEGVALKNRFDFSECGSQRCLVAGRTCPGV